MIARSLLLALLVACGGETSPINACVTPSDVVTCDEQNFYTFALSSADAEAPSWSGSTCRAAPCVRGDACEIRASDGTFVEGVCE